MNFHEKENRLIVIREISRTSCCVIFVKRKKKETPMSEKTWRFREKTSDFGQHWFYYPLFGNPISGENCLKNDLTIRPVFKRKKIPPFALIKRRR